jgi:hypothetical protein
MEIWHQSDETRIATAQARILQIIAATIRASHP